MAAQLPTLDDLQRLEAKLDAYFNAVNQKLETILSGDPEQRLTIAQVVKLTGLSKRTLLTYRQNGKLPGEGEGKIVRYRRGTVLDYMKSKNIPFLRLSA